MVTNGIDVSSKYNVVKVVQKKRGRSSSVPIKLMKRYRPDDELLANETKVIQNDSKVSDMMEEDGCGEFAGNNENLALPGQAMTQLQMVAGPNLSWV